MREIKIRAKANIDNEWIYASNIHKVVLDDTNEELWVMHPKGEKIEHLGDGYIKYRPLVVDEETIGQYTGLKDKNGVEIYEGDIVCMHYFYESGSMEGATESEDNVIGVVGIDIIGTYTETEDDKLFWLHYLKNPEEELEVIGNIYEHQELLNRQQWEFTEDEKVILRNLPDEFRWIARDGHDSGLFVYVSKPTKSNQHWSCGVGSITIFNGFKHLFQCIQWSDDEPCEFRKYL